MRSASAIRLGPSMSSFAELCSRSRIPPVSARSGPSWTTRAAITSQQFVVRVARFSRAKIGAPLDEIAQSRAAFALYRNNFVLAEPALCQRLEVMPRSRRLAAPGPLQIGASEGRLVDRLARCRFAPNIGPIP